MLKERFQKMIIIEKFEEKYRESLARFILSNQQLNYTNVPLAILEYAISNINSTPFVVLNNLKEVVGFFVLESYYQYPGFSTGRNVSYILSLSINEAYQGNGYGKKLILSIPNFVKKYAGEIKDLYLVVDYENTTALNLYEEAGFCHVASIECGGIGEERLYHLNLQHNYVNDISLNILQNNIPEISIDILKEKVHTIGKIKGVIIENHFVIQSIDCSNDDNVLIKSLRKLPPVLREISSNIEVIELQVLNSRKFSEIASKGNFVKVNENNNKFTYYRFIR